MNVDRKNGGAVLQMRTKLCLLVVLTLFCLAPTAAACPVTTFPVSGHLGTSTCYLIDPMEFPPVAIYECDSPP